MREGGAQLGLDPRVAGLDLRCARLLVQAPRSPLLVLDVLHGIRDADVVARQIRLLDARPQDTTGRADEGMALAIFLIAGLLADQHERRSAAALAEHGLRRVRPQRAPAAALHSVGERGERPRVRHERCRCVRCGRHDVGSTAMTVGCPAGDPGTRPGCGCSSEWRPVTTVGSRTPRPPVRPAAPETSQVRGVRTPGVQTSRERLRHLVEVLEVDRAHRLTDR